jgi:hypothetical protein
LAAALIASLSEGPGHFAAERRRAALPGHVCQFEEDVPQVGRPLLGLPARSNWRPGHTAEVYSVAYSPDGKVVTSGTGWSGPNEIKLWDVATGTELATLEGHTDVVCTLAYSPDGKTLASGSWDATVKLWAIPLANPNK